MIPNNFFVDKNGICTYIEIFTIKNNNSFLLHISAKYKLTIDYKTNIFNINQHRIDDEGDLLEQHTEKSSIKSNESGYDEITISNHADKNNIRDKTEDLYNRPIKISNKETTTMKGMFRQVRRLGLCMRGTKYGMCVMSSSHMYCVGQGNVIEGYSVTSNENKHKYRKYFTVVDFELLYAKVKNIVVDIGDIKTSISDVLGKNFHAHISTVSKTFPGYDIKRRELAVTSKINEYEKRLLDVESKLENILKNESSLLEKRNEVSERLSSRNVLSTDMESTKNLRIYDTKISEIVETKKELFRNIVSLKIKRDHTILKSDEILFDVAVMCQDIINKMNSIDNL